MDQLGQMLDTDASTINKLEKRKTRISTERLLKLADILGVTTDEIVDSKASRRPSEHNQPDRSQLPVMGVAAGSLISGAFQLTAGPVEYIDTPKVLENARGVYALYVDGKSMEPMFRHGSKIICSEFRPSKLQDAVVVQEQRSPESPIMASVGILESRSTDKIVIRKLNPDGLVEINAKYVIAVHKVLEYSELLGN